MRRPVPGSTINRNALTSHVFCGVAALLCAVAGCSLPPAPSHVAPPATAALCAPSPEDRAGQTIDSSARTVGPDSSSATIPATREASERPVSGPSGELFGDGGHARRIVFVFDSTGSMMQEAGQAMEGLLDTVAHLRPEQSFNVILLSEGPEVRALNGDHLLPATPDNRRKLALFLDTLQLTGSADPLPALRLAFQQKPDLIYILCDGRTVVYDWADSQAVNEIRRLEAAAGHGVTINTVLWNNDLKGSADILAKVARENGGHFRFVRENDLVQ